MIPEESSYTPAAPLLKRSGMKKRRGAPVSLSVCLISATLLFQAVARAQDAAAPAATLSCTEMETYLKTAKVVSQKSTSVGVTAPSRAMLDNGTLQHEALIQTVDIRKTTFPGSRGTELNFRDAWRFRSTSVGRSG